MAIKTLRVFQEFTSEGYIPMPVDGNIDYGYTIAGTFPSTTPTTFQTDDPDLDVEVTETTDFYVWIRSNGTAWNPMYTRNVRVYPDSPTINNVVMGIIIARLNDSVPYTGATDNVDLGEFGIKTSYVEFDTTPTDTPTTEGTMSWDEGNGTANLTLKGGEVNLAIGQELVARVYNDTGEALVDGQIVYITGAHGNRVKIGLASNSTEMTSSVTFGMVTEPIAIGAEGFVTVQGTVNKLNTVGLTEGAQLWLGETPGSYTDVKPIAPLHAVLIGYVERVHATVGSIYVKIQNGYELEELHDVLVLDRADEDIIQWSEIDAVWKNINIFDAIGATDVGKALLAIPPAGLTIPPTTKPRGIRINVDNTVSALEVGDQGYIPFYDDTDFYVNSPIFVDSYGKVIVNGEVGFYEFTVNGEFLADNVYINTFSKLIANTVDSSLSLYTNDGVDWIENLRLYNDGSIKQSAVTNALIGADNLGVLRAGTKADLETILGAPATSGTLTANYIPVATDVDSITDSILYQDGTNGVVVNGTSAAYKLQVNGTFGADEINIFGTGKITANLVSGYITHQVLNGATYNNVLRLHKNQDIQQFKVLDGIVYADASGYLAEATSGQIIAGLGFVPYNSTNPDGFIAPGTFFATSPLSWNMSTNTISMTQASDLNNGWLSASDWTMFNNKGNGTVTSVAALTIGTTGTDISSSVATSTTTPVITLNIPTASATNRGALSSADWNTFNNKQNALTYTPVPTTRILTINGTAFDLSTDRTWTISASLSGLTTNYIQKAASSTTLGNSLLFDNGTGVGINTISITYTLDVNGTGRFNNLFYISRSAMTTQNSYSYQNIRVTSGFGSGYTAGRIQSLLSGYDGTSIYGADFGYSYDGTGYTLHFSTNDNTSGDPIEGFRLTSSQNVLIGTTTGVTGGGKLQVNGNVNINGSFQINGVTISGGGGSGVTGSGSTGYLPKWSSSSSLADSIIYDDGSSVTVGSNTILYKLAVTVNTGVHFGVGVTNLGGTSNAVFLNSVTGTSYTSRPMLINADVLAFSTGYSEAVRIDSTQNILIGTTSGVSGGGKLQVNGDVNISGNFKINGTTISTGGGVPTSRTITINGVTQDLSADRSWTISTGGGIGGSGTTGRIAKFSSTYDITNSGFYDDGTNIMFGVTSQNAANGITFNGGSLPYIGFNQNVGTYTWIEFKYNGSLVGAINTTTTNTNYATSSDYRLKDDLRNFNGIELINKINVYDFKWKVDNSRSYGVMAHELQEILPYAVTGTRDGILTQAVDYSKIVPLLIQAIKDQQVEIDSLKKSLK